MNDIEIRRLAHALNELRPDWPISSLTTWIGRNLAARPYRDAALALVWVALDAKPDGTWVSDRPARVLESGPWWQAATGTGSQSTPWSPPRKHETCRKPGHGAYPAANCAGCRTEGIEADPDPTPEPSLPDGLTGPDAVRAVLRARVSEEER